MGGGVRSLSASSEASEGLQLLEQGGRGARGRGGGLKAALNDEGGKRRRNSARDGMNKPQLLV